MTGRQGCASCLRPQSACSCRWARPTAHQVEVLILQHPLEADHPKGTARLLQLSLASCRLLTGEVFDASQWQHPGDTRQNLLLYPDLPSDRAAGLPPPAPAPGLLQDPSGLRLIVLDSTWRKSRKMLWLNPSLQQLPRLSLRPVTASNYRIRRAHRPGQLSTLEAVCAALSQLEGSIGAFEPLLEAFDGFVVQQLAVSGQAPKL